VTNTARRYQLAYVLAASACVAGCSSGVLNPQGPVGADEKVILFDATTIMLAVVIPVIICTLAFAWWFRARNKRATRLPDWEYSGRIEFITWSIPAMIVIFLGGIAWIGSHDLDPRKALSSGVKPVEIEVISLDWKWVLSIRRSSWRQSTTLSSRSILRSTSSSPPEV
jgi:cytochrome o ubiquinol oxidase subunit 2